MMCSILTELSVWVAMRRMLFTIKLMMSCTVHIQDVFDRDAHGKGVVEILSEVGTGAESREADKQLGNTRVEGARYVNRWKTDIGAGGGAR